MASGENENEIAQVYLLGKTNLANKQEKFFIRNDPIAYMAAGDQHTIIVTETGRAFAFGDNSAGQLGLGHTDKVEKVSCIKSLKFGETGERVILAACGRDSSLVATNRGSLYAFGSNSASQLGLTTTEPSSDHTSPVKIDHFKGRINWKQISMGAEHSCALNEEGLVYLWGANDEGQCGQAEEMQVVKVPTELRMSEPVVAISCGYYHTALVTKSGRLYVLGNNDDRQLGRAIPDKYGGPEGVSLPNKVIAVACGHQHTVVLTDKGQVYACGLGDRGQIGLGSRVFTAETFELIPGLPKNITAIAAGEAHTAVLGSRKDIYVFGDGKHGKLGFETHSNEFAACFIEKFRNYDVLKVVCGGCQTIVLAQKNSSESKKLPESIEDIGNATISITQQPKSHARSMRNKNSAARSTTVTDSMDSTIQHARPLGKPNSLRVEADDDDDRSDNELSASLKSATFNQTHTITNGRFLPTQSPTLNRTSFRHTDDGSKALKTGILDRTTRLNEDPEDLGKTNTRLPLLDKTPVRNVRSDPLDSPSKRKKQDSDDDKSPLRNTRFDQPSPRRNPPSDEEKSSSDEKPRSFRKQPEPLAPLRVERARSPSPLPIRNERKPSPPLRRQTNSDSENDKPQRASPIKPYMSETLNRKPRQRKQSDDDDEEEEEATPRRSGKQPPPPPPVARRGSLPPQTRSVAAASTPRDGNQTIGSRTADGVRGSFRGPATKTLAKPLVATTNNNATTNAVQPGFFSRLFGSKSTPSPPPPPPTTTPATTNSRACSVM